MRNGYREVFIKTVSVLIAAAMLLALIPTGIISVSAATVSNGTCGANLTWNLDSAGNLTISGTGEMNNYDYNYQNGIEVTTAPWGDGIKTVTINSGVTSIGEYAFFYCTGLTSVTIGNSVMSIGVWAFCGCTGLTSVTIPDSVTSIGDGAFSCCAGLTSVTIPASVTSIGFNPNCFDDCDGIESITVAENNPVYYSAGNCLIETGSKTLVLGCKNSVIPSDGSVTSIGDDAFFKCTGLTSVTIPASVTSIGDGAFSCCAGLTSVTIGNGVTSIGEWAFFCCTGLTSVTIPNSVTSIGDLAFAGCTGLTSVTIPASVTSIGNEMSFNVAFDYDTTLFVHEDSYAYEYAVNHGFQFVVNPHEWSKWEVIKPPTYDEKGEETRTCSVCSKTMTRAIPKLHDHVYGEPEYVWADDNSTCAATAACTFEGCRETLTETVNADIATEPATCTGGGKTTYTATFTDEHDIFKVQTKEELIDINPEAHAWGEWETVIAATCEEVGEETRVCANDREHTETRPIEAIGHDWSEWQLSDDDSCRIVRVCRRCGSQTVQVYKDSNLHKQLVREGVWFEIIGVVDMIGDTDEDKSITVADALAALRIAAKLVESTPASIAYCDVDADGFVTVADALSILRVAAKLVDELDVTGINVTWKDYDGTVLKTEKIAKGAEPSYSGSNPFRSDDASYEYTFTGWSPAIEEATRDITYVARYSRTQKETYTITYDANGGTGTPLSQTKSAGTPIALRTSMPKNGDYELIGWSCAADGIIYKPGEMFSVDADTKLYAVWGHFCTGCHGEGSITIPARTETCSTCYGTGYNGYTSEVCPSCQGLGGTMTWVCDNHSCYGYGRTQTFFYASTTSAKCAICGYSLGHYISQSPCSRCNKKGTIQVQRDCYSCGGRGYHLIPSSTETCEVCNGAKYTSAFSETYNLNLLCDGVSMGSVSVQSMSTFKLTVPTKKGYSFLGWYDAQSGGKQYTDSDGVSLEAFKDSENKTLYAHWQLNYYIITYVCDDDISLTGCLTVYTVEDQDIKLPKQSRENSEVVWTIDGKEGFVISTSMCKDIVVEGAWR